MKPPGRPGSLLCGGVIGLAWLAISATSAIADPVVQTMTGEVVGSEAGPLSVFRGIPYAAPPVGPLRWREPQPPATRDRLAARAFGPACIQPVSAAQDAAFGPIGAQSEDCLTLNVWTPTPAPDADLPVMVWIHGGGFISGSSEPSFYGPEYFMATQEAVLVRVFSLRWQKNYKQFFLKALHSCSEYIHK